MLGISEDKQEVRLVNPVSVFDRLLSAIPRYQALKADSQTRSEYKYLWQLLEEKYGLVQTDFEFLRPAMTRRSRYVRNRIIIAYVSGIFALFFALFSCALVVGNYRLDLHLPTVISLSITAILIFSWKKCQIMPNFEVKLLDLSEYQLKRVAALRTAIINLSSQDIKFFTQAEDGELCEMPSIVRNDDILFNFVLGNMFSMNAQFVMAGVPTGTIFVSEQEKMNPSADEFTTLSSMRNKSSNSTSMLEDKETLLEKDQKLSKNEVDDQDYTKPRPKDVKRGNPLLRDIVFDDTKFDDFSTMIETLRALKSSTILPRGIKLGPTQERWIKVVQYLHRKNKTLKKFIDDGDLDARKELESKLFEILRTPRRTAESSVNEFLKLTYRDFMAWVLRVERYLERYKHDYSS